MAIDENTKALVEALDRLTAEVAAVRVALESPKAVSQVPKAAQAAAAAVKSVRPAPLGMAPSIESAGSERNADEIEQLFAFLFMAAQDTDSDAGFENFVSVMHSDRTDAPRSIPSLKEFNWRTLRKNAPRYLSDPDDPTSFEILSRTPETITSEVKVVKIFMSCPGRSPVPVTLKRDAHHFDAWRITDSSL